MISWSRAPQFGALSKIRSHSDWLFVIELPLCLNSSVDIFNLVQSFPIFNPFSISFFPLANHPHGTDGTHGILPLQACEAQGDARISQLLRDLLPLRCRVGMVGMVGA